MAAGWGRNSCWRVAGGIAGGLRGWVVELAVAETADLAAKEALAALLSATQPHPDIIVGDAFSGFWGERTVFRSDGLASLASLLFGF